MRSALRGSSISIFILLIFSNLDTLAQRIIVTGNGDRIVMYPDGSWRMAETGDSVLLRQNLQKSETLGLNNESTDQSQSRSVGEQEEYILRQWNELHFKIKAQEKKVQNEFRAATNAQFSTNELLQNAEANKNLMEPDRLAALSEDYERSIRNLRQAKLNQKTIQKIGDMSKKLAGMSPSRIESKLNPLRSKFNLFLATYDPAKSVFIPDKRESKTKSSVLKSSDLSNSKSESEDINVSKNKISDQNLAGSILRHTISSGYTSEPFRCKIQSDTVDEATGRRRIELAPGLIFTHTDPDLRPYFKNKELITCYGKLSKIDAYIYLLINFQIASSHSQSNFGSLQNGSLLRLLLLNGEYVSLYNLKTDRGHIDPYSGYTIFTGQYALGKDETKKLLESELDKIRILWSTGYEDYDVYKVDFFIDQINCLQSR